MDKLEYLTQEFKRFKARSESNEKLRQLDFQDTKSRASRSNSISLAQDDLLLELNMELLKLKYNLEG